MSLVAIERGITPEIRSNTPLRIAPRWSSLATAGLLTLSQVLAGCSQKEAIAVTVGPEAARPTATVTAVSGVGGNEPFAPVAPSHENAAELNDIIKRLNDPLTAGSVSQEDKNKVTLVIPAPAQSTATVMAGEAQKPTTEIKLKPYECSMFQKDMCPYVDLVDFINPKGTRVLIAGINLPEGVDEIPVFAAIPGGFRKALNNPNYAELGDLNDITLTTLIMEGPNFQFGKDDKVKVGDQLATLKRGNSKIKIGEREYDARMAVSTKDPNTGQFRSGDEVIRRLFTDAPTVSAQATSADASSGKTNYTVTFEDTKPAGLR